MQIEAGELAKMQFPPILSLLGSWLTQPSLGMVYGWRGSGKTYFALSIAYALASAGRFFRWQAKAPSKVLYIDGEMGMAALQKRQNLLHMGASNGVDDDLLYYSTFEHTHGIIPNLADPHCHRWYDAAIADKHVVIIDNLCTCMRPIGRQSDADAWSIVQPWATAWRARGKAILFVHHSGKSGTQLGTSTKEQPLDYVIALRRPPNASEADGCVFEMHFEKKRDFFGEEAAPLWARLVTPIEGGLAWEWKDLSEIQKGEVYALADKEFSPMEISAELGMELGKVKFILRNRRVEYGTAEDDRF